jgi:hypothetical protein
MVCISVLHTVHILFVGASVLCNVTGTDPDCPEKWPLRTLIFSPHACLYECFNDEQDGPVGGTLAPMSLRGRDFPSRGKTRPTCRACPLCPKFDAKIPRYFKVLVDDAICAFGGPEGGEGCDWLTVGWRFVEWKGLRQLPV